MFITSEEKMTAGSDVQARLRLFRYGLLVVVVVTFLVSLLAPLLYLNGVTSAGIAAPPITDFLGNAVLFTIVVAVAAVVVYALYHYYLTKSWPMMGSK
jgi:hypothetical protein